MSVQQFVQRAQRTAARAGQPRQLIEFALWIKRGVRRIKEEEHGGREAHTGNGSGDHDFFDGKRVVQSRKVRGQSFKFWAMAAIRNSRTPRRMLMTDMINPAIAIPCPS